MKIDEISFGFLGDGQLGDAIDWVLGPKIMADDAGEVVLALLQIGVAADVANRSLMRGQ